MVTDMVMATVTATVMCMVKKKSKKRWGIGLRDYSVARGNKLSLGFDHKLDIIN
jgi:hypothetical protein